MKAARIISGIFAIVGGFFAFMYPGLTTILMAWVLTAVLAVSGISLIFTYIKRGKTYKQEAAVGAGTLVLGILFAIIGILGFIFPGMRVTLDLFVIIFFVIHLISSGISMLGAGIAKKGSMWVLWIILGIILILAGIYGIVHIFYAAVTLGLFIGIGLWSYGVSMLCAPNENKEEK